MWCASEPVLVEAADKASVRGKTTGVLVPHVGGGV